MRAAPLVLAGLCLGLSGVAHAQEVGADHSGRTPGTPESRLLAPIDFWGKGTLAEKVKSPAPALEVGPWKIQVRESVWAQPVQAPDGTWMLYVPPKPVLDFLENPTEATAKAYLAWKSEQGEKIARAMALLAQVKAANAAPPKSEPGLAGAKVEGDPGADSITLIYFKKPSCPHCMSQDQVLAQWLPKHPRVGIQVVLPEERAELWKGYGVRGTPTLVLRREPGKEEVRIGLQSEAQLDAALGSLAEKPLQPPEREEKERSR